MPPDGVSAQGPGQALPGEPLSIPVRKEWLPANQANLPEVTVHLLRDGKVYRTLTLGRGNWSSVFENVPRYGSDGHAYAYAVSEQAVLGYTLTGITGSADIGFVITNTARMLNVYFIDWNGTVLRHGQVPYGGSVTPPKDPTRPGHLFTGWVGGYVDVTRDEYVRAQYQRLPDNNMPTGDFTILNAAVPLTGGRVSNYGDCLQ